MNIATNMQMQCIKTPVTFLLAEFMGPPAVVVCKLNVSNDCFVDGFAFCVVVVVLVVVGFAVVVGCIKCGTSSNQKSTLSL